MKMLLASILVALAFQCSGNEASIQIEVECQFVEFDAADINKLAVSSDVLMSELIKLWAAGKGTLVAAPRVVTRSGSEATVRGVREFIYPTEFSSQPSVDTNRPAQAPASAILAPAGFETRETGAILSVIPELSPEGTQINLNLRPEWVSEPDWLDYGLTAGATAVKEPSLPMKQPVFYRHALETQVTLANCARILVGGGVPGREKGKLIFIFLTARVVDADGVLAEKPEAK